jgi:hypothetical protein
MRRVEAHWVDSHSWDGWAGESEYRDFLIADRLTTRSIGYVIADDEAGLLLVQSYQVAERRSEPGEHSVEGGIRIPRVAIVHLTELGPS